MSNKALQEWLDEEDLRLPPVPSKKHPQGKSYRVPSPDIETGILLQSLSTVAQKVAVGAEVSESDRDRLKMDDDETREFSEIVLGSELYAELLADGVSWTTLQKITKYVFVYFAIGPEAAQKVLPAPKAKPQDRKPKKGSTGAK